MKKIAVLTSGGDAPGMNAAIRAVVRTAVNNKMGVYGVMRGYEGLISGDFVEMNHRSVSNIITLGGTMLKTSRSEEFMTPEGRRKAADQLKKRGIEGLIVIGGNGSFQGAHKLYKECGIPVIGVPGTIDNDLSGTDYTIGADTAVNTALNSIDKIRDTVDSMERIFVVEVMGRDDAFIAIRVGLAGGAEDVLVPHSEYNIEDMCDDIREGHKKGKISWILVVSEGVGSAKDVADLINENTGLEVRHITLGHVQRGGSPTAADRILGLRLGEAAVKAIQKGESDKMAGAVNDEIVLTNLEEACKRSPRKLGLDRELYRLTRALSM
ncbi:MAG: 6-phosphofructokinase [Candidatus Omnitrophica bacterium]|nr:6-phosphofructokinase [Candidatus Omnitrophota bacterium]MBU4488666.1 6-phosphofructokinase [Candidatus Omnitrophota bacterium]